MGRPPKGQAVRAASARVMAAGKQRTLATSGPRGTTRAPKAMKADSTTMRTMAPGRVKARAHMRPGP